ncbi:hypothetical protein [Simonsiella muelleri]|uniref:hypothetical protein n=1 Tax=Simonsiella muelleri TaxID=72 RepID=UPI0028D68411|nr:hypothetical protein [Simonsiella muelleri]
MSITPKSTVAHYKKKLPYGQTAPMQSNHEFMRQFQSNGNLQNASGCLLLNYLT